MIHIQLHIVFSSASTPRTLYSPPENTSADFVVGLLRWSFAEHESWRSVIATAGDTYTNTWFCGRHIADRHRHPNPSFVGVEPWISPLPRWSPCRLQRWVELRVVVKVSTIVECESMMQDIDSRRCAFSIGSAAVVNAFPVISNNCLRLEHATCH